MGDLITGSLRPQEGCAGWAADRGCDFALSRSLAVRDLCPASCGAHSHGPATSFMHPCIFSQWSATIVTGRNVIHAPLYISSNENCTGLAQIARLGPTL